MEKGTLKIMYTEKLNLELDEALVDCLKEFGYEWYGQGTDLGEGGVRDIVFEKKGDIKK
jgi:hypothetical protein